MRMTDIKNIIVISEFENFSKASAYLHISQPALSQSVQRLESALGCKLCIRGGKHVSLTAEGEIFVKEGSAMLNIYEKMILNISKANSPTKTITIAASSIYARYYFPEIFRCFKERHERVNLQMLELQNREELLLSSDSDVDFAVIKRNKDKCLKQIFLFQEQVIFAASKEIMKKKENYVYERKGKKYIDLRGFENVPFLSYSKNSTMRTATNEICRDAGFIPNIIYESGDPELISEMISCNMGVGFLASLTQISGRKNDLLQYYFIENNNMIRDYVLAYKVSNNLSNEKKDLIDIIQSVHKRQHHSVDL